MLKVRSFDDLADTYKAFGVLGGDEQKASEAMQKIEADTLAVAEKIPDSPEAQRSTAVIFYAGGNIALKLENSIVGQMLHVLGVKNIATGLTPANPGSETAPLDIEAIIAKQPDSVLITSMSSSNEEAKDAVTKEFSSNNGWKAIDAVRENKVSFLPQQYFLYNAGPYYADALKYLSATIYPETFGEPVEP
ncbi:hypothetical protein CATYP_00735 [Corynebacterium atypicum]|uniref:Fe/B12 periplasmic-binding domain-containing protein n=1 Tax=Corynebacterium atypicum TaxID=191610 RepID=A0ABM5QKZ9_9CORY|nr:hypothetical protein CATYP_00735 [Corynebacterium atypicum]